MTPLLCMKSLRAAVVTGHLDVARAVAWGAGEDGIFARDAAMNLGRRFLAVMGYDTREGGGVGAAT